MDKTNQVNITLDTSALIKATGGNKTFFNQMMDSFIDNATETKKGLEKGLKNRNWKLIGEKAHKAMPSFKYFDLEDFVVKFKTLEDATLRSPEHNKVSGMVVALVEELEVVILEAQKAKITSD